jgi:hypothetical protein
VNARWRHLYHVVQQRGRMYRPSGIAIVTAGLGALALFHVVWGRDTGHSELGPLQDAAAPWAALNLGTPLQVHSVTAWRAWPAPVEDAAPRTPVALPAPEVPANVPPVAGPPDQSTPIQQTGQGEPGTAAPAASAGFIAFAAPDAPPAAREPTEPMLPAEGRMALAGPQSQGAPPPVAQAGQTAPNAPPEVGAAAASQNKFGPAIFKQFDRGGGS